MSFHGHPPTTGRAAPINNANSLLSKRFIEDPS